MSACEPHDAILLDAIDNVAVALREFAPGETARVRTPSGLVQVRLADKVPAFFKLATENIAENGPIRKYGQVIGIARSAIQAGAVVHIHNLRSTRARSAS